MKTYKCNSYLIIDVQCVACLLRGVSEFDVFRCIFPITSGLITVISSVLLSFRLAILSHYLRYICESIECRHMVLVEKLLRIYRRIVEPNNIQAITLKKKLMTKSNLSNKTLCKQNFYG